MADYCVSVDGQELTADYMCLDCDEFQRTEEGRAQAEDDGCIWPGCFFEQTYARFPIFIPKESL